MSGNKWQQLILDDKSIRTANPSTCKSRLLLYKTPLCPIYDRFLQLACAYQTAVLKYNQLPADSMLSAQGQPLGVALASF